MTNSSFVTNSAWKRLANQNPLVEFVDVVLRGYSQVMFQNNALTGLLFFIAIGLGAYFEGMPQVAIGCLLGTVVATITAYVSKLDKESWRVGLFGYNGCLLGVALPAFLDNSIYVWMSIILGSIVSVISTIALMDFLKKWKVAALTAPFVLVSWTILLASYNFLGIEGVSLPAPELPHHYEILKNIPHSDIIADIFRGISEVFLFSSVIVGLIFTLGLAVSSIWAAVFAVVGSLLAYSVALFLKADVVNVQMGLYSFSAVLTAIALGSTFNKPNSFRVAIYAIVGVIFTVFVQGALDIALDPLGIPTLTMPFVLASWLFLVPNNDIMPKHRR